MSTSDDDCDWICDKCGAYMNNQPGFNVLSGTWTCADCGALNDVSSNNVLDLLGMLAHGITEFITHPLQDPDDDNT